MSAAEEELNQAILTATQQLVEIHMRKTYPGCPVPTVDAFGIAFSVSWEKDGERCTSVGTNRSEGLATYAEMGLYESALMVLRESYSRGVRELDEQMRDTP
jgi:hypothetical protein